MSKTHLSGNLGDYIPDRRCTLGHLERSWCFAPRSDAVDDLIHIPEETLAIPEESSKDTGVHFFGQSVCHLGSTAHPFNYYPFP